MLMNFQTDYPLLQCNEHTFHFFNFHQNCHCYQQYVVNFAANLPDIRYNFRTINLLPLMYICIQSLFFSLPSVVNGWSQPHPLRQLVWWRPDCLLAVGHMDGVDTIVEFSLQLDREKHSVEITQT